MTLFTKIGEFAEADPILGPILHVYRYGLLSGLGNKRLDYEGFKNQCTTMVKMRYLDKNGFLYFDSLLQGLMNLTYEASLEDTLIRNENLILTNSSRGFKIMYKFFFGASEDGAYWSF